MKKYIYLGITVAIVLVSAVSAYFLMRGESARSLVPNNAKAVAVLNMRELIDEAGISVSQLSKVDNKTGFDFSKPVYVFATEDGYVAVAANIDDVNDLENNMSATTSRKGLVFGNMGSWVICHDDSRLLMVGPLGSLKDESLLDMMCDMMSEQDNNCELLDSVEQKSSPFSARINMEIIPRAYRSFVIPNLPNGVNAKDINIDFTTHIQNNKMSLQTSIHSDNDRILNAIKESGETLKEMEGHLLIDCPDDPVIWMGVGVKGDELLKLLRQNDMIRTYLLALNMSIDLDMMINAIDGDVSISIPRLGMSRQDVLIQATLTNTNFLANAKDWNTGFSAENGVRVEQLTPTKFHLQRENLGFYFGVDINNGNHHVLYATNQSEYVPDNIPCFHPEPLPGVDINDIKGNNLYVTVNMQKVMNTMAPMLMMMGYSESFYQNINNLSRINLKSSDNGTTLEIVFQKDIKEILEQWN